MYSESSRRAVRVGAKTLGQSSSVVPIRFRGQGRAHHNLVSPLTRMHAHVEKVFKETVGF